MDFKLNTSIRNERVPRLFIVKIFPWDRDRRGAGGRSERDRGHTRPGQGHWRGQHFSQLSLTLRGRSFEVILKQILTVWLKWFLPWWRGLSGGRRRSWWRRGSRRPSSRWCWRRRASRGGRPGDLEDNSNVNKFLSLVCFSERSYRLEEASNL